MDRGVGGGGGGGGGGSRQSSQKCSFTYRVSQESLFSAP